MDKMKLSRNFLLSEFLTGAHSMPAESHELIKAEFNEKIEIELYKVANCLQVIRDHIKKPITITCGFRPEEWDIRQGRDGQSAHCKGMACDFTTDNLKEVFMLCKKVFPGFGIQINEKLNFIHFDTIIEPFGRNWSY